jgi:hypothetical protein
MHDAKYGNRGTVHVETLSEEQTTTQESSSFVGPRPLFQFFDL